MAWYQKKWFIVLSCIFFFPLGFFLIKRNYPRMKKGISVLLYVLLAFWVLIFLTAIFGKSPKPQEIKINQTTISVNVDSSQEITFKVIPSSAVVNKDDISFSTMPSDVIVITDTSDYKKKDYGFTIQSQKTEGTVDVTIKYAELTSNTLQIEVLNPARIAAVNELDSKISALFPLTLEKEKDVEEIRRIFDSMDPKWQKTVKGTIQIDKAEKEIETLYNQQIEPIRTAITDIGEVTLKSEPNIVKARALYNESSDSIKAKIPNELINQLIDAEEKLSRLKLEAAATPVSEAINHISIDSYESITSARTAYEALPEEAKAYVENYSELTATEQRYQQLTEERAVAAVQQEEENVQAYQPQSESDSEQESKSDSETVYWVDSGEVYHSTKDCPSLGRSKNIYSGTVGQSGKSRPCKNCY